MRLHGCVHTACFLGSTGATSSQPGMLGHCRIVKGVTGATSRQPGMQGHSRILKGATGATSSQLGMQGHCRFFWESQDADTGCRHRRSAAHVRQCHTAPNLVQEDRLYQGRCKAMPRKSCLPCMASEMSIVPPPSRQLQAQLTCVPCTVHSQTTGAMYAIPCSSQLPSWLDHCFQTGTAITCSYLHMDFLETFSNGHSC